MPPLATPVKAPAPQAPSVPLPDAKVQEPIKPVETPQPKSEDILKRVGETKPVSPSSEPELFSSSDLKAHLDTIQDPQTRKMFEGVYNNMERGLKKKFEQIGHLEKKLQESTNWTPERLSKEVNKPDFIQAAERVIQTQPQALPQPSNFAGNSSDWSALSDTDRAYITNLEARVTNLQSQNEVSSVHQADTEIKQRIPHYSPERIDQLQQELRLGKWNVSRIREALHKADSYERDIEQAYKLGLQDQSDEIKQKMSASTLPGGSIETQPVPVSANAGESRAQFFRRIALERLSQVRQGRR